MSPADWLKWSQQPAWAKEKSCRDEVGGREECLHRTAILQGVLLILGANFILQTLGNTDRRLEWITMTQMVSVLQCVFFLWPSRQVLSNILMQCFLRILLLPSLELQCLLFTLAQKKKRLLITNLGEKRPGFLCYETRQKIRFFLKWQLSVITPTIMFDARTKAWVLRGILLLISKKIEDNHL